MTTTPMNSNKSYSPDPAWQPGANVAVGTCMAITVHDRVIFITDRKTDAIATALVQAADDLGAVTDKLLIEDYVQRPVFALPEPLAERIRLFQPSVSFFVADSQPGELTFRNALSLLLRAEFNTRHAHMVGITPIVMREGMNGDYHQIAALTHHVTDLVQSASHIQVTSKKGTALDVAFSPEMKWRPCHGLYHHQGDWGNLPEGETFTSPRHTQGTIVADVLGDYFSSKYGLLPEPVTFDIVDSVVTDIRCARSVLAAEIAAYLDSEANGRRVGEFAIGTNTALKRLVGNLLQDEKYPGIHIAFGSPLPHLTGATWSSHIHVDVIPTNCTIRVDGRTLMADGEFSPEILAAITPAG